VGEVGGVEPVFLLETASPSGIILNSSFIIHPSSFSLFPNFIQQKHLFQQRQAFQRHDGFS
jgi:hypothetical protein